MSNDTTATTSKAKPTHKAYNVRKYQQNGAHKSDWTVIGVAWQHGDGEGFDIVLECLPLNGRVALRKNKSKSESSEQA